MAAWLEGRAAAWREDGVAAWRLERAACGVRCCVGRAALAGVRAGASGGPPTRGWAGIACGLRHCGW